MSMWFRLLLLLFISGCDTAWADNPPTQLYDEGTLKGTVFQLDCQGTGVSCSKSGVRANISINGTGVSSLTGLSDVGSATIAAGRVLIADGTKFQSVAMSGGCTIASSGVINCSASSGANQLTGLSDVGSATETAGRILIADGTKFQSKSMSGDSTITSAGVLTVDGGGDGIAIIGSSAGTVKIYEATANGTNNVTLTVPTSFNSSPTYTLPANYAVGFLKCDGTGICSWGASSLTGQSDIGSATITAGNMLIADGTAFQSKTISGGCTITSSGVINCSASSGASQLTGLSDVGSATATAANLLIADGTKFQSKALSGDVTITSAGVTAIGSSKVGPTQISSTTVTAGTYGSAAMTVDADGRITFAAAGSLTGNSDVGSATATAGRILIADGTNFKSAAITGCALTSAGVLTCSAGGGWTDDGTVVRLTTSSDSVGIGTTGPTEALDVVGQANTSLGYKVGGTRSLFANSDTNLGTFVGHQAGVAVASDGLNNTFVGYQVGKGVTTGDDNTGIGHQALAKVTTSSQNTAVGSLCLDNLTSGSGDTGFGYGAAHTLTTGSANSMFGRDTGLNFNANSNVAFGDFAFFTATSAFQNTGVGQNVLFALTTGNTNTAIGYAALDAANIGSQNTAIGTNALGALTDGQANVAVGLAAASAATGDNDLNTIIGYAAGNGITIGADGNVLYGYLTGSGITTGDQNIAVGYYSDLPSPTGSNQMSIGNMIYGTGINGTGSTISTGKVGIGLSAPAQKLSVGGGIETTGFGVVFSDGTIQSTRAASALTGLSDVGSATETAGRILIADGTKFQSTTDGRWFNIKSPASSTTAPLIHKIPNTFSISSLNCIADSGTSVTLTLKQCNANLALCSAINTIVTCATTDTGATMVSGAGVMTGGNDLQATIGTVTGTVNNLGITVK